MKSSMDSKEMHEFCVDIFNSMHEVIDEREDVYAHEVLYSLIFCAVAICSASEAPREKFSEFIALAMELEESTYLDEMIKYFERQAEEAEDE